MFNILLLLSIGCITCFAQNWTYRDIGNWGNFNPQCNGFRQSPIALHINRSTLNANMLLEFWNYHLPFAEPISIINNGYWLELNYNGTTNGWRPTIVTNEGTFATQSLHFHWGSSDHAINGFKYAAELHIVHMNVKYGTLEEALRWTDGVTVLAVLLANVQRGQFSTATEWDDLFAIVPFVVAPKAQAYLHSNTFTLNGLLGGVNRQNYFKYAGSLTTPPCAEAVTFIVFMQPLALRTQQLLTLWQLYDWRLQRMVRNFRPLQKRNKRPIYFKLITT